MLKKICAHVGCNAVIPAGQTYCDKHQCTYNHEIRRTIDRKYDTFYHSKEWRQLQRAVMQHYHGMCVYSYIVEHVACPAGAVHHIVEVRDDYTKRLDMRNLMPVSAAVHDGVIRQMYRKNKQAAQAQLFQILKQWNEKFQG